MESKVGMLDEPESKGGEGKGGDAEEEDIVLRFMILPEGFPHFMSLPRTATVDEVRRCVADDLQLPPDALILTGAGLDKEENLMHLEVGKEYEVNLEIQRDVVEASTQYKLPSSLEVVVHFDDDNVPSKTIIVDIVREDLEKRKPYLGGYRNKKTGIEFHHAATQRFAAKKQAESAPKVRYTRETQTAIVASRTAQTIRESGTQMARPDLLLDTSTDKLMIPKPYFNSDMLHALRVKSTLTIQRYWRGYMARVRAYNLRLDRSERLEEQHRLREAREQEEKEQHKREVERRMNPTKAADFEVLYNELENWRQHETDRIKSTPGLSEKDRQKQLEELLHKETKLLQTIDRLKLSANEGNRKQRIRKVLEMMSAPKKWQMSDGDVALVHTPFTTRAKELFDLYEALNLTGTSVDERLDILLHVKWTAKEFDCGLTRDLVDLIDREADLLNRGRAEKALTGLRKRISTLFLQFVETPDFNPEAARFQQVPRELVNRPQIVPKLK